MKKTMQTKPADESQPVKTLKPDVAEQYELADGTLMVFADSVFGYVDLSQIDLDFADRLAEAGYLKKKTVPAGDP